MEEVWKPIRNFENYFVSNLGRVKTIKFRVAQEKILKPFSTGHKYNVVTLSKHGIHCNKKVHRLVAEAFLENELSKYENPVVDHIDENKFNNCLDNLRITTNRDNISKNYKLCRNVSSRFHGVHWSKKGRIWVSQIVYKGKAFHLGRFIDEEEAGRKYQDALSSILNGTFDINNRGVNKYNRLKNGNKEKGLDSKSHEEYED